MGELFKIGDAEHELWLSAGPEGFRLHSDAGEAMVSLDERTLTVDGAAHEIQIAPLGDRLFIHLDGAAYEVAYIDPVTRHAADAAGSAADTAHAPMPGAVVAAPVQPGDTIEIGDVLMIIESMKLETAIKAWRAGTVETVHVAVGASFDRDAALVTLASLKEA